MKTQQQAQIIFDTLIDNLQYAHHYGLIYVTRSINGCPPDIQNPLEHFLTSIQKNMVPEDFNREFLSRVYAEAFHTGDIPNNRNHIAMNCDLTIHSQSTSPLLKFWIDLDNVAELTNSHFTIQPPYRFEVEYRACNSSSEIGGFKINKSSAVNSVYDPYRIYGYFLIGCIYSAIISGVALLIAALAVASLIALSTAAIYTAVGIGVFAGVASAVFFKAKDKYSCLHTNSISSASNPENIVDIFQQHFAATIDKAIYEGILPQDRVEIIDEPVLNI